MTNTAQEARSLEDELERTQFGYQPINPEESWDRDRFVVAADAWLTLKAAEKGLKAKPGDLGAREELSKRLMNGDKKWQAKYDDLFLQVAAKTARKRGDAAMALYVERNKDSFFNLLSAKDKGQGLVKLILEDLPLYPTGNADSEHDKSVDLINGYREMVELLQSDDPGKGNKMRKKIKDALKRENMPSWVGDLMNYFMEGRQGEIYMNEVYQKLTGIKQHAAFSLVQREDNSANVGKIREIFDESERVAQDAYDDETDEGKKGDIRSDVQDALYKPLAEAAYKPCKGRI